MSDNNLCASLKNIVLVELGDQMGDYAALLMAGLGTEVIKLEPPEGSPSRSIGPFASATPDPEQSIFFWRYNLNKKSVSLDLDNPAAVELLRRILAKADILLLAGEFQTVERRLEQCRRLAQENPRLCQCGFAHPASLASFGTRPLYESTDSLRDRRVVDLRFRPSPQERDGRSPRTVGTAKGVEKKREQRNFTEREQHRIELLELLQRRGEQGLG